MLLLMIPMEIMALMKRKEAIVLLMKQTNTYIVLKFAEADVDLKKNYKFLFNDVFL